MRVSDKRCLQYLPAGWRCVLLFIVLLKPRVSGLNVTSDPPGTADLSLPSSAVFASLTSSMPTAQGGSGLQIPSFPPAITTVTALTKCRDRFGLFPPDDFSLWTCGFCLRYLFAGQSIPVRFLHRHRLLVLTNSSSLVQHSFPPDPTNSTIKLTVCGALTQAGHSCHRWLQCCSAARACCGQQLDGHKADPGSSFRPTETARYCPATWDGYRCWDNTPAGSTVTTGCPAYIQHASVDALATKICNANGTWYISPESRREWTDYTSCVKLDHFWVLFWVGVVFNVVSLALLLPSCFIFFYFSYVLTNVLMIMWEVVVVRNRLTTGNDDSVLRQNSVGCRILHSMTRYSWTTNFMWMFLEGLHLYRLMVHSFAAPRSLVAFYTTGFGVPWISTLVYASIRATHDDLNTRCWVQNAGAYEWIIYTPLVVCIAGNLFFLGTILFVMVTQLQSHPNEPSSFRRAVKAAAMLVPLLGLQVLMVVYRPDPFSPVFEVVSKIITNTQGALVAIGFCYLNGEVLTIIRNSLPCSFLSGTQQTIGQRFSVSTQNTTDGGCRSQYSLSSAGKSVTPSASRTQEEDGYFPLSTLGDDPLAKTKPDSEHQNGFV